MKYKAVGFIPDTHLPFEDQRAYSLMIKVFRYIDKTQGLKGVCVLGDYLDMYGLSFYEKDPSFGDMAELYDREIAVGNDRLDELDQLFPNAKKWYIEGNHEYRFKKYMNKFAGALRNRLSVVSELQLNNRPKWSWVPYSHLQGVQIFDSPLWARHEPYGSAQPKTQAQKAGDSFVYGHTHQVGEGIYKTNLAGREVVAINSGCLIDFKSKVFDYVKSRPDWVHAFTVAWVNKNDFHYQVIKINKDYTCVFDGKIFKG